MDYFDDATSTGGRQTIFFAAPRQGDDDGHAGPYDCSNEDVYCEQTFDGRDYKVRERLYWGRSGVGQDQNRTQNYGRFSRILQTQFQAKGHRTPSYQYSFDVIARYPGYYEIHTTDAAVECRQVRNNFPDSQCFYKADAFDGESWSTPFIAGNTLKNNSELYFSKIDMQFVDATGEQWIAPTLSSHYWTCSDEYACGFPSR